VFCCSCVCVALLVCDLFSIVFVFFVVVCVFVCCSYLLFVFLVGLGGSAQRGGWCCFCVFWKTISSDFWQSITVNVGVCLLFLVILCLFYFFCGSCS